ACSLFFFSSRRRHTRWPRDWSSDVCSSDLILSAEADSRCTAADARALGGHETGSGRAFFADRPARARGARLGVAAGGGGRRGAQIGRASWRGGVEGSGGLGTRE